MESVHAVADVTGIEVWAVVMVPLLRSGYGPNRPVSPVEAHFEVPAGLDPVPLRHLLTWQQRQIGALGPPGAAAGQRAARELLQLQRAGHLARPRRSPPAGGIRQELPQCRHTKHHGAAARFRFRQARRLQLLLQNR